MTTVFVLQHTYEHTDDGSEDSKLIGVYSSKAAATQAMLRARRLPGFGEHPDGFDIDGYQLDEDHWTSGFGEGGA